MGSMQELTVLLDQLKPGELIYCLRDTGYKDMISFMDANAGRYFFMMLPKQAPLFWEATPRITADINMICGSILPLPTIGG